MVILTERWKESFCGIDGAERVGLAAVVGNCVCHTNNYYYNMLLNIYLAWRIGREKFLKEYWVCSNVE